MNVITNNTARIFLLKNGQAIDPAGKNNFHPLSTTNGLIVHIEDGVPENVITINYTPSKRTLWTSHNFPLFYRGMVEHEVDGTLRTFAQYFSYVPSILLAMNKNGQTVMNTDCTVIQATGQNLLGSYSTLSQLTSTCPPTQALSEDKAIAFVIEDVNKGYYTVIYDSLSLSYAWVKIVLPLISYGVEIKQYNVFPIVVQRGFSPTDQTPQTFSDEILRMIYQEINYLSTALANHEEWLEDLDPRVDDLEYELGLVKDRLDVVEGDIETIIENHNALEVRVETVEQDVLTLEQETVQEIVRENTPSVEITLERNENEVEIKADVKLSSNTDNGITIENDGLYLRVSSEEVSW